MDIVAALRKKVSELEDGDCTPGLKAVLLHIETAFRHFARGQETNDETAFTDAIYRNNQAFEGSIKEAYRVLAGRDPSGKRPFDIETYLESHNVFRSRVLKQFTMYRTEWRNPSTHDYRLDFDASEAFLATVSVTAFACVLIDQIAARLSYIGAQKLADDKKSSLKTHLDEEAKQADLSNRVIEALRRFFQTTEANIYGSGLRRGMACIGAIHGFLSSIFSDVVIEADAMLPGTMEYRADLLLRKSEEIVMIEVSLTYDQQRFERDAARAEAYMRSSGIRDTILCYVPPAARRDRRSKN